MKATFKKRLLAMALAVCMSLSMVPGAMAAGVDDEIAAANQTNNFDYAYGTPVIVDAGGEGEFFSKTFKRPDGASGTLYAAVLPVDENGAPMDGMEVRYVRLSNNQRLNYFRADCRYFAVQLVRPLPDGGSATLSSVEKTYDEGGYQIDYTAALNMSSSMAMIVDTYKDHPAVDRVRFICHIRFSDDVQVLDSTPKLESSIFQVVSQSKSEDGYGYDVVCELREDWKETGRRQTLVQKLQDRMTFTASAVLNYNDLKKVEQSLHATGWIEILNLPDEVLDSSAFQVPMATHTLDLKSSSGGGASTPDPDPEPVEKVDPEVSGVSKWLETEKLLPFMTGIPAVEDEPGQSGSRKLDFRPNQSITRAEIAQMFFALLKNEEDLVAGITLPKDPDAHFNDVPDDAWFSDAVNMLGALGMVKGTDEGNYEPLRPITRAEFAVIAVAFGILLDEGINFRDVPIDHWARKYIATAGAYGWVTGNENGDFMPNRQLSRAEAATIVNGMLKRAVDYNSTEDLGFNDVTRQHWAWAQILAATDKD